MTKSLPLSSSKKDLFKRLGLKEGDPASEKVHKQMMEEAKVGRDYLSRDYASLAPWNRDEPDVIPPYLWTELMETARHAQVLAIYRNASDETRVYYDRGRYFDGAGNEENWAVSWCLWHSFRSYRSRRPEPSGLASEERQGQHIVFANAHSQSQPESVRASVARSSPTTTSREGNSSASPPLAVASTNTSTSENRRRAFFDPVRDLND